MESEHLTERQKKWFASVAAGLHRDTGRTLEQWAEVARTCPHTGSRARVDWLRSEHGLGVNRASTVLWAAFSEQSAGWGDPQLMAALWSEPASRAILEAVQRLAAELPGLVIGQRKGFTAFSRGVQFAAMRPLKGGAARLGLKLDPEVSPRLTAPARKESWSERLTAVIDLSGAEAVASEIGRLLRTAWERG